MSFGYYSYDSPLPYDVMWDEEKKNLIQKVHALLMIFLLLKKLNCELKFMVNKRNWEL
jgi:hypothetical protein